MTYITYSYAHSITDIQSKARIMGKTKQTKAKKFDRNVEISAPILDPEVIRAIHSPPKDKKLDIRHGGFKALLSDLNSQDSTDELSPITENHLPSYIGISCAVSGYSNYSSYIRRPLEDVTTGSEQKASKFTANSKLSSTPNRSHTDSPNAKRSDLHHINHVTIDRSHISSPDQERKELTEKLTASATERRRSPSPLPPIEDGRHHGAYVGARYFPMPEPSKLVHKHIPLLGIDDDQDPDQFVPEDTNKVEKQIANLYGDEFVEDWKESMSHKAKKELQEDTHEAENSTKHLKDLVNLKPTPPKAPEPVPEPKEVPTPDVKVLASVEKQFLNRLLTDENPPVPRSPSPQPMSPVSPVFSRPVVVPNTNVRTTIAESRDTVDSPVSPPPRAPTPPPQHHQQVYHKQKSPSPKLSPQPSPVASPSPVMVSKSRPTHESPAMSPAPDSPRESPVPQRVMESFIHQSDPIPEETIEQADDEIISFDDQHNVSLNGSTTCAESPTNLPVSPSSPDSQRSTSTVEAATQPDKKHQLEQQRDEQHIKCEVRASSPIDNDSSPDKVLENNEQTNSDLADQKPADLVSFSPEPTDETVANENGNNNNNQEKHLIQEEDLLGLETSTPVTKQTDDAVIDGDNVGNDESVVKDGRYFLSILEKEESFIMEQVKLAESRLAEHEADWNEDTVGKVRSAIGKANLLINKKCNQFRELCEKSLVNDAGDQYAVLNDDLAGFWDMITIQIADVRRSFENL